MTKAEPFTPKPNSDAVITSGNARFTVLTPRVIRLEWTEDGVFEDHATLVVVNRETDVPNFSSEEKDGVLAISTDTVHLTYKVGTGSFKSSNLSIKSSINDREIDWNPRTKNKGNLKGTARTLDRVDGPTPLDDGILSKEGWTLLDDTLSPVFDNSDLPWVMARAEKMSQDWYFMAYGNDYRQALADYTLIAGKIAFPPRYAFGAWQSRWWKYTDQEFKELVEDYRRNDFPLDVLVIDMDWHTVNLPEMYDGKKKKKDQAGQGAGWTGFTWNENYFPDYKAFLKWTDDRHVKTCMNLHPASGIQPHEGMYEEFAKAMGQDPSDKKYVPFNITDKKFADNYFDLILHPYQDAGVDFWWLDWQQWGSTDIPGVNPTYYLNYVHYTDMERRDKGRPLIYHRWGGLGNHRYQIGFSGDNYNTWKSLAFQPYFTATAANVGWGYWGHDLGGFFKGEEKPELFTRWIQYGIFSPIVKIHYWAHSGMDRRPWVYPPENVSAMRDAYKLRYALIPYIYTMARKAHDTGVSLCRPMYYNWDCDEAYKYKDQYLFGDDLLIAPVIAPMDEKAMFSAKNVWLPPGQWFDWSSGSLLDGDRIVERGYTLDEIPVFVRAGAIIPMMPEMMNTDEKPVDPLILNVFPGANGSFELYEDAGNDMSYKAGASARTQIASTWKGNDATVTISGAKGSYPGMPADRAYELRLPMTAAPKKVLVNGKAADWTFDGNNVEVIVKTERFPIGDAVTVELDLPNCKILNGMKGKVARSGDVFRFARIRRWPDWKYPINHLVSAAQTGNRAELKPADALKIYKAFNSEYEENLKQVKEYAEEKESYKPLLDLLENAAFVEPSDK